MAAVQDELVLLERVFLRIGAAETDEQLQNALQKFLPPVLLKLSSPQEGVRKKVMELLVHINKRLKSRPQVLLPVEPLLVQYQDPAATSFLINFTIIYLKMGFPRLDFSKQIELLPNLLSCVKGKPQQHQDSVLMMVMTILPHVKVPQDPEKSKNLFGLPDKPYVAKLLNEFMLDVLFLPYGVTPQTSAPPPPLVNPPGGTNRPGQTGTSTAPSFTAPAGLSENSFKRVTGEKPLAPDELETVKLGIVKFLSAGVYPELDIISHLIIGSSDTRHSVASAAEMELKRISGGIDWNNQQLSSKLFDIYLGTVVMKEQKSPARPEHVRTPASTRIRLKLLPYILKSREAATQFPAAIQLVFHTLYGQNTNQKLRLLALQFVHSMCLHNSDACFSAVGSVLITGMMRLIQEMKEAQDCKLRGLAYIAVGKIGRKLPQLVMKNLTYLCTLFESLQKEDQDTRLSVQEALNILAPAFKSADTSVTTYLEALISSNIESNDFLCRQMALHYAATVFDSDHIPSRYILLLGTGDMKEDIRREALKALNDTAKEDEEKTIEKKYPSFPELVSFISKQAYTRMVSNLKYIKGNVTLPFSPPQYIEIIRYLRNALCETAGVSATLEKQEQSPVIAVYVQNLLSGSDNPRTNPVMQYVGLIQQFLPCISDPSSLYSLLEIAAVAPESVSKVLLSDANFYKNLMSSSKEEIREYAAHLYAIILTYTQSDNEFYEAVESLQSDSKQKTPEMQQGALLALGHSLSRKRGLLNSTQEDSKFQSVLHATTLLLVQHLKNAQSSLAIPACTAIGEIGRSGPLPLPAGNKGDSSENEVAKSTVVEALETIVKNSKLPFKCREKAAQALGYICVGDAAFPHCQQVLEALIEASCENSDIEVHFTIGDSICCAVLGPCSITARDFWTVSEKDFKPSMNTVNIDAMEWFMCQLIEKYIKHSKPSSRQAACIWTLSILKHCSHHPPVLSRLKIIQSSLLNLLSDRNDMTQSIASKCLSLLYEMCDEEDRKELVQVLLDTLVSGRKSNITVTEDTKLFDEGTLGSVPTGGGLTTYKELCSLASDLNQPDLVYKFMHLANHHAMWNSKKGAAFGFSSIAEKAGEQLAERLPEIVPKLYRYQYDPNSSIRSSFNSIWKAIVKDSQKTIDKYVKEILDDLIQNLTNNEWRVRESSCMALSDLLRGRQLSEVGHNLPTLWKTLFRVRDDIKESVRNAAESALKTLSKTCVKICDNQNGKSGEQAVSIVMPCLIENGLMNQVSEVREISLSTLVQISKSAGPLLKPHLAVLFVALLEALSELEPQVYNYLSMKASAESKDKLDAARVAASRSSPMMDTINHCVQYVDDSVLSTLVPRLVDLIKSSVGLGTKAGCSHLVITITHQCPMDLQPYASKLLAAFVNSLGDKNATVRKSYAAAIGHLTKVAKDSSVEKVVSKLRTWYLEKDDSSVRFACAYALQAMARHSPDVLRDHGAAILPLAFFAMHENVTKGEDSDSNTSLWEEIWTEFTPGTEAGVKLYLSEIVALIHQGLDCQFWSVKQQAAMSATTVAEKASCGVVQPYLGIMLESLLCGLVGRTWTGKESLLKAISSLCVHCIDPQQEKEEIPESPELEKIAQALLKECRKENWLYKEEAVKNLAVTLEKHQLDYFGEMFEILEPLLKKDQDTSNDDSDEENNRKELEKRMQFQESAYDALARCWPTNRDTQEKYQARYCELLIGNFTQSTWKVQISILKALNCFISKLQVFDLDLSAIESDLSALTLCVVNVVCLAVDVTKYPALRIEAVTVMRTLISKLKESNKGSVFTTPCLDKLKGSLQNAAANDSNITVKDLSTEVLKAIDDL